MRASSLGALAERLTAGENPGSDETCSAPVDRRDSPQPGGLRWLGLVTRDSCQLPTGHVGRQHRDALVQLAHANGGSSVAAGLGTAAVAGYSGSGVAGGTPGPAASGTAQSCAGSHDWGALRHLWVTLLARCTAGTGNRYDCAVRATGKTGKAFGAVIAPLGNYAVTFDGNTITYRRQ